eukprot:TRINITY_DN716_c0_g1_i1.p1 TRINITY_DN716_c0_g1~~TRINITY_DN716_c0_g1_i1.p1  ORF type:complete len:542 (-),score=81.35 TRINITY_DN716_c0_g1_i1:43-1599(-)
MLFVSGIVLSLLLRSAEGHGQLTVPQVRPDSIGRTESWMQRAPVYTLDGERGGYSANSIRCHDFTNGAKTTVQAGTELDVKWTTEAGHPGDCYFYVSYDADANNAKNFFKIAGIPGCGASDGGNLPGSVSQQLMIPADLPACDHCVLRWEWTAHQQVSNIEFYVQCADIKIVSNAPPTRPSPMTEINGIQHLPSDASKYRQVYANQGPEEKYLVGPAVATYSTCVAGSPGCVGDGSSPPQTTPTPTPTPTTPRPPTPTQTTQTPTTPRPPTPTPTPTTPRPTTVPSGFEVVNGGTNQACRGANEQDTSNSYYTVFEAKTLAECVAECTASPATCKGIEYNPSNGRCEVWTRDIEASKDVTGYSCYRYNAETGGPAHGSCGQVFEQCGGDAQYRGSECCVSGLKCHYFDATYSQCLKDSSSAHSCMQLYEQCGGSRWSGSTCCAEGLVCVRGNEHFSQCLKQPGALVQENTRLVHGSSSLARTKLRKSKKQATVLESKPYLVQLERKVSERVVHENSEL